MKYILSVLALGAVICGCSKSATYVYFGGDDKDNVPTESLISPKLYATASNSPFTGILEVYPCVDGTPVYYGNYLNDKLYPFNAYYKIKNGSISESLRPVLLPPATYNMLYWGVLPGNTTDPNSSLLAVRDPAITIKGDLSKQNLSLIQDLPDTAYHPVYNLVYGLRTVDIVTENIDVSLKHAVASVDVVLQKTDGSTLDSSIDSVVVYIGSIANNLNFYTAEPENFGKTVKFGLSVSPDNMTAVNLPVTVFPSGPKPRLTILLMLKNGEKKQSSVILSNSLVAGTQLSVTVNMGEILVSETEGNGFEIDNWNEKQEVVDTGNIQ